MGGIRILSASAGSGKTYRLADELKVALVKGAARPEAVVATTFTRKAAGELAQRVRTHLLRGDPTQGERRYPDLAQRLTAARIGTVHSVCHGLVRDFAFELGLSPELEILAEETSTDELDPQLARVVSEVTTQEEIVELDGLVERFGERYDESLGKLVPSLDWAKTVQKLLRRARENGLEASDLRESRRRSLRSAGALIGKPAEDGRALEKGLLKALRGFFAHAESSTQKGPKKIADDLRPRAAILARGAQLAWQDWIYCQTRSKARDSTDLSRPFLEDLEAAARLHDKHPDLRKDVLRAVELVFDIAERSLKRYQDYKRQRGVLDYADLELYTLKLLGMPQARARLRETIDLVLVDEFQDTNPIQLAIFLKLADLAKQSIWVGDQKQSIYGFRGADPALMEAVLARLEKKGQKPEALPYSWRSRPELVELTSDLFAPAFARQGIPEARVRLKPAPKDHHGGRGEPLEHWVLSGDKESGQDTFSALAAGVRELLADPKVKVLDKVTQKVRRVEARDIAILAYSNKVCALLADRLEALGVPATVARSGLGDTSEAVVLRHALTLHAAPADGLSAAVLARYLEHPTDADGFLRRAIGRSDRGSFTESPLVQAIRASAKASPGLGLLETFDRVVELIGMRELCRRWGDAETRLANLEALRAYAVAYVTDGASTGEARTMAGLLGYLAEQADEQAIPPNASAVSISTWHRSKGLEWPVTILLFKTRRPEITDLLDVSVASELAEAGEPIDLADPLKGRYIRYWPNPFGSRAEDTPLATRLEKSPVALAALAQKEREELRYLYVVWTRARDCIVLAQPTKDLIKDTVLELLNDPAADESEADGSEEISSIHVATPDEGSTSLEWTGNAVPLRQRFLTPLPFEEPVLVADKTYSRGQPRQHPPAFIAPSTLEGTAMIRLIASSGGKLNTPSATTLGPSLLLGSPLEVAGAPEWDDLGNAVHAFLAADRPGLPAPDRLAIVRRLLAAWRVSDALTAEAVLEASDRLGRWVASQWKDARWTRELLMRCEVGRAMSSSANSRKSAPTPSVKAAPKAKPAPKAVREETSGPKSASWARGTVLRGVADLVLQTSQGLVVIDHKTFRGALDDYPERPGKFAFQVGIYADVLERAGAGKVIGRFVHMPLLGEIRAVL